MYYRDLLNSEKFRGIEAAIEERLHFETRERVIDGKRETLAMSKLVWPYFDHLIDSELATLREIRKVADAGMTDFPQRGYEANFAAAVMLFYDDLVGDGKPPRHQGEG